MLSAPLPSHELQRLKLLHRLQILDTQREQAYDDLVEIAQGLCGVPISLVSLVDEDRQWFKARIGLQACETGRNESFCAHVVHSGQPLVVRDALQDRRFHDNPLVTQDPSIRFYAGFPLKMPGGEVMGTLCVIDTVPRELDERQLQGMRLLAGQVSQLLRKRQAIHDLEDMARELGRRERIFELGLRAAGEAVWDWNLTTGELNHVLQHAEYLGYPRATILQSLTSWKSLIHPDDIDPTWRLIRDHMKGLTPVYEADYRMRHEDGHWVWVRSRGEVVERDPQGRATRMLGTVAEISQRKALEQQVLELNERLRSEADQARALADSKARFLATMAHEIRTPLNSILGAARLALDDVDPQALRDNLKLVHEASSNLARLVDSILDFSRLDAQRVELELSGVSVRGLIGRLLELFQRPAHAKGVAFRCEVAEQVPVTVRADAMRVEQVLINLVGNALKFTAQGSVSLRLDVMGDPGDPSPLLRFEVRDTGVGIDPQRLSALFKPFGQADESVARRFGGTGLGLVIARQLARLMGGDVSLESKPGRGTTATFTIPLQRATTPLPTEGQSAGRSAANLEAMLADLRGLRVLVVDDNTMNLTVMQRMLSRAGLEVRMASRADKAEEMLAAEPVDIVLMDLYMPDVDGAQATRRIRAIPAYRELPILAVSASVTPEERDYCRLAGMDGFVPKPVRVEDLLAEIRRIVQIRNSGSRVEWVL
jgi:PAS domain S-box-containing protein